MAEILYPKIFGIVSEEESPTKESIFGGEPHYCCTHYLSGLVGGGWWVGGG